MFTQLLANKQSRSTLKLVDYEDLLILANCLYRLGQMTRLANERRSINNASKNPTKYFSLALKRLQELSENLHDKQLVAPTSERRAANTERNLPEPNLIRHHIRLCETLSGWVKLELAEWYGENDPNESRQLLFDALRHAESARGEADSHCLLAAASAQMAQKLVDDAMQAQQDGHKVRTHNLSIEAQLHIERVIGLAAVSPEEDGNLEESRSLAWSALGQLFQTIQLKPQLAEWSFFRMNDHRFDVSDLVDMMTDRLLHSRVPIECYQHAVRTRDYAFHLLYEYRELLGADESTLTLYRRDMAYAIAVHEWYRSTDPSRLLTLARESNMALNPK